jgi:hypothetical protein
MFSRIGSCVLACVAGTVASWSTSAPALAGPQIVWQSVEVDRASQTASFTLALDAAPDFHTVDALGRPAFSFQYEIDAAWTGRGSDEPLDRIDVVVRGDEVRVADALRVRDASGAADPDPLAGGWGRIRDVVPFDLSDNELRFDASLGALGDGDGVFAYRVFTTEFGATTSLAQGQAIPLPPAAYAGVLGLAAAAWAHRRARAAARR